MIRSMSLLTTELAYALSMLISAMLLTHCCPWCCVRRYVFNLRNALTDRSAEHNVAGITPRICITLENSGNISNTSFLCIASSISEHSYSLIRAHDEISRIFSAWLRESRRRFCKIQQRGRSFLYQVFHCDRCFPKHRVFSDHFR